jgi:hypothetical protein
MMPALTINHRQPAVRRASAAAAAHYWARHEYADRERVELLRAEQQASYQQWSATHPRGDAPIPREVAELRNRITHRAPLRRPTIAPAGMTLQRALEIAAAALERAAP